MRARLALLWRVIRLTVGGTLNKDVSLLAAGLAFFSLISLAPFLIIAVAIGGALFGDEAARAELALRLSDELGPKVADFLIGLASGARDLRSMSIATLVSALILFWGSTRLFLELRRALHTMWDVPPRPHESWRSALVAFAKGRFLAALGVLIFGVLFLALLAARVVLNLSGEGLRGGDLLDLPIVIWIALDHLVALLLTTGAVLIVYKVLPERAPSGRALWLGALLTAALLLLGRSTVALYVSTGTIETAYGAAGSLVVFMIWAYFSSIAFLIGARLTHVVATGAHRDPQPARLDLSATPPPPGS